MNHRFGQQDAIIKHSPASVSMRTELGGDTKRILDNHYCSLIKTLTALQEAGLSFSFPSVLPLRCGAYKEDGSKLVLSGILLR